MSRMFRQECKIPSNQLRVCKWTIGACPNGPVGAQARPGGRGPGAGHGGGPRVTLRASAVHLREPAAALHRWGQRESRPQPHITTAVPLVWGVCDTGRPSSPYLPLMCPLMGSWTLRQREGGQDRPGKSFVKPIIVSDLWL